MADFRRARHRCGYHSPKVLENLFKGSADAADETLSSSGFGANALMLAITHRLVLAMGGNLTGESELGIGSTFTLRLPADMKSHLEKQIGSAAWRGRE